MNASISREGLWSMIQTLSNRNKRWLADKLAEDLSQPTQETEEEILEAIGRSLKDVKCGRTYHIDSLWDQLK